MQTEPLSPGRPLIDVHELRVHYPIRRGIVVQRQVGSIKAVDGINFSIQKGETLGLVGESGSGKTTTGAAILQLVKPTSGEIVFEGQDLVHAPPQERRQLLSRMQMIFQDPYASLNPRMTIGNIIGDPMRVHGTYRGAALNTHVRELMDLVNLDPSLVNRYPHQFSGGQRQRVGIARSLAVAPAFIICDEPVSALDVSIQAQILNLLTDLQRKLGLTYLFISHDLSVVRHISTRVAVMYLGKIVEIAESARLYSAPQHPYTQALLSAIHVPNPALEKGRKRRPLRGDPPNPANPPQGCSFSTRCPLAVEKCHVVRPDLRHIGGGHWVSCHLVQEPVTAYTGGDQAGIQPQSNLPT